MQKSVAALTAAVAVVALALLSACSSGTSQDSNSTLPSSSFSRNEVSIARPAQSAAVQKVVTHYYIVRLGALGGNFSNANALNNKSWIVGVASLPGNKVLHGALWQAGHKTDLGTLGGPNSAVFDFDHNTRGLIPGISETSATDPYGEDWCGFGTTHLCQGFRWRNGRMTPLPTLGGNNGLASDANNRGQISGYAETSTQDPSCQAGQVFDYYAVIWQPNGMMVTLRPYPGDVISAAISINQQGLVVGASGLCVFDMPRAAIHAVLWQNGSAIDLGNLGGTEGNVGNDINNRGQVVGASDIPGDQNQHAFLWQNGVMTDLNLLVPPNSKMDLYYGGDINDRGEIASAAYYPKTGKQVAVLLIPGKKAAVTGTASYAPKTTLRESMRTLQKRSWGMLRQAVPR